MGRALKLAVLFMLGVLIVSAQLVPDALTDKLNSMSQLSQLLQQQGQQKAAERTEAGHAGAADVGDAAHLLDYDFTTIADQHKSGKDTVEKPCPEGCEKHGNCNKALGRCECPVGYAGADCSKQLWPSCKLHPKAAEMYCGTWHPKSCACIRECAKHVCPDGPSSCERAYDLGNARCFERPEKFTVKVDGEEWDGGSSLPAEGEPDVKYYIGVPKRGAQDWGVVKEVPRAEFVDLEPQAADGLMALPLSDCPEQCHFSGGCLQRKNEKKPHCRCHYGFAGDTCKEVDLDKGAQHTCWNNCQGRGVCRRGFCQCEKGWWGKDCSRSKAYAAHTGKRLVHKLNVYAYDLPWELAYQPEYHLGWRDHDQIYMAWKVFGEMFFNDTVVRTENPWEANMFYIPAMMYAYSSNLGDTLIHAQRVIDYVRQTWPFFNRTKGLDHFVWLTNDRGACQWPGGSNPELANVIKVVHFAWHHTSGKALPQGWHPLPNKHWGCFHPLRDISATPYWLGQADVAAETYGLNGLKGTFDVKQVPNERLLFFAGGIRPNEPDYSNGVRQELHRLFGKGQHPNITIHEGGHPSYTAAMKGSKFCMAPSGHGWGIRLSQYMAQGCVPVIIQDDTYQAWEDLLPYPEFSIRLPTSRIPAIAELLAAIPDEDFLALRAGVAKYWRAFVWPKSVGGLAYDYMIASLRNRMVRLHARQFHPLQHATEAAAIG